MKNKEFTIRMVRNVCLVGDTTLVIDTEKDARALALFIMQNVPDSTKRRMADILIEYTNSPEPNFSKFMKGLK
jgi:hypothetical protein